MLLMAVTTFWQQKEVFNDSVKFRLPGQRNATHGYLTPLSAPQSSYGTIMEIKVTNWLEAHGGVDRSFDPIKRKWTTKPIFYPVIKLK